jgi:hypothetical protein
MASPLSPVVAVRAYKYHRMMSSIGSQLIDRDYADCWVTADILVRQEPDEEDEEEEQEEEDDDDEGEDDGDSDGYSE